MKVLKISLFIIAVLILLFIVLGFIGPKFFDVNRSISLNAPVEIVYEQVSDLSNIADWDPWKEEYTDMKSTINGSGYEVGSYRRWESSESVGEELLVELQPNKSVETELKFIEPFAMHSIGYYILDESVEGTTSLTMGFKGKNSFLLRALSMIPGQSMEAQAGPMFERALKNISVIVADKVDQQEASKKKMISSKYAFGMQEMAERTYILKRGTVPMAEVSAFYTNNLGSIYTAVGASGVDVAGKPCGIYYSWDEENGTADMCAAIPVGDKSLKIEGYQTVTMPAGRVVKVPYTGDYSGLPQVHNAIDNYMKAYNLTQDGPVVEEYITDPQSEPDPSKWLTNIYYSIK
jgi:effector-binding domain-containing protein